MLCCIMSCRIMLYYVMLCMSVSTSVSLVALIKQLIVLNVVKCLFSNIQYFPFLCFIDQIIFGKVLATALCSKTNKL